ncbi:MAG: hypothetical protein B7Y39_10185 [Bdellovibrio sp. 28-41-41]|nr:MAG: hypothetical protein B7Y39_10185 [Bdellovibrio sp. 28-41-41]
MKFYLEITPAIINKTAIHNIIKDTIHHLPQTADGLLFMGKSYKYTGMFKTGMPRLLKIAIKFPRLFILARRLLLPFLFNEVRPIFFFDPLYILFYPKLLLTKVMVLDLTPLTHPHWHHPSVALLYKEAFQYLKKSNIVCYSISESTRLELKRHLQIEGSHSQLIYIYANKNFMTHATPVFSKQVLFVGSFEPRKNLTGLINGFLKSTLPKQGYVLNIVGAKTAHYETLKSKISDEKSLMFHGYLSEASLIEIYKNAQIFAYPSHWEGFGVPLLEAINMKIACFASNKGACQEIGGPEMKYVNPESEFEIAQALELISELTVEEYKEYTNKISLYACKFTFEKYIQDIEAALQ